MRRFITESLVIVCFGFSMLTATLWEERNQYKLELEMASSSVGNYSGMLATCLNGKPLYDRLSGKALFTEPAITVDVKPIRKKNERK